MKTMKIGVCAVAVVSMVFLAGCPAGETQQTIAELTQVLTQAVSSVAALEGNSALSAKILADGSAVSTAIANWKNGSKADDVVAALNLLEADLYLIPAASQYAPLIDIAISAIDALLTRIPPSALSSHGQVFTARSYARGNVAVAPKTRGEFVKQWNAVIALRPALSAAIIH